MRFRVASVEHVFAWLGATVPLGKRAHECKCGMLLVRGRIGGDPSGWVT